MKCKICQSATKEIASLQVLQKYAVAYHRCTACDFIQTDEPHWLKEAYTNAITSLDIGLVSRNQYLLSVVPRIIDHAFPEGKIFVDYGGGYGMFVRMMRDAGYDFYRQDIYCENLFARHFDIADAPAQRFDLLTAFEVFEHLADPVAEIKKMLGLSDHLVFSTELSDRHLEDFTSWWYVAPQTGQHIAFYNSKTFARIASALSLNFYTNGNNLHILTRKVLPSASLQKIFPVEKRTLWQRVKRKLFGAPAARRPSLLQQDFEYIKSKMS